MTEVKDKKLFPCIWQAIIILCACFFITISLGVAVAIFKLILQGKIPDQLMTDLYGFFAGTINLIALGLPALGILFFTKTSFKKFFHFKNVHFSYILAAIIMLMGCKIINSEIDNITRFFLPMPEFIGNIFKQIFSCNIIIQFYILVFVAGITEELLFRGVILRAFLTHYSEKKSILVSAAMFSLFHLNPYQMISAFVLGIVFGWLYVKTKSIWFCIFCHGFSNFIVFIGMLMPYKISGWNNHEGNYSEIAFQPLWFNILGLILLVIGFTVLYRLINKNTPDSSTNDKNTESSPDLQDLEQTPI